MLQRPHLFSQRPRRSAANVAACAALVVAACGVTPRAERQQAIADGTPDAEHASVFLLVRHDDNSGGLCTATLIAPNLLLTARHCVSPGDRDEHVLCGAAPLSTPYPAGSFFATNDPRPSSDSPAFRAAAVRVPHDEVDTCGYDIALVILSASVPSDSSTPAVPRIDRDVTPGELYTAVGYGVDESGEPTGRRMQRAGLSVDCEPGTCGDGVEASEFRGETGICSGDSGGPALDADGKVVGVVSRGGPDCSTPVYGTVTAWQTFIVETAREAAELGGYEVPFWVTTGLSDPPIVPSAGGAGGAGGAGAGSEAPVPEPARAGEACDSGSACAEGLACYAPAANQPATCVATCQQTADCSAGLVCEQLQDGGACVLPSESLDEGGGCAVAPGAASRGRMPWLLALLATSRAFRRRLAPRAGKTAGAPPDRA